MTVNSDPKLTTRIFKSSIIQKALTDQEQIDLVSDFRNYKEHGILPDLFGRDVAYDHPHNLPIVHSEELQHIHLVEPNNSWGVNTLQINKTSDKHLVYCQGFTNANSYLLMAILSPNAHTKACDNGIMYSLGRMAELFRMKY